MAEPLTSSFQTNRRLLFAIASGAFCIVAALLVGRLIAMVVAVAVAAPPAASAAESEVLGRVELPPMVEAAFEQQAGTQGLKCIRRVVDSHGLTTYTADIAGTGRTVEVTPDGRLLSPRWASSCNIR
jgi:hypothetical protein